MLKPFSGDALQKIHRAIGSRPSTTVDPQHNMVKASEETDGDHHALAVTRQSLAGDSQNLPCHVQKGAPIKVAVAVT